MTNEQAPGWFKPVSIVALIWNLIGVLAFVMTLMVTPEMIAELPEAEQALFDVPAWATIAFAIAVFAGVIGCVLLLMRKAIAFEVLVLSIIGVIVQNIHGFLLTDTLAVHGPSSLGMPVTVFIIGVGLIMMSNKGKKEGWLS